MNALMNDARPLSLSARFDDFRANMRMNYLLWVVCALGACPRAVLDHPRLSDPGNDPAVVLSLSSDAADQAVHRFRQLYPVARRRRLPHRADQHAAILHSGGGVHADARLHHCALAAQYRARVADLRNHALYSGRHTLGAGVGDLEMDLRSAARNPQLHAVACGRAEARLAAGRARHSLCDCPGFGRSRCLAISSSFTASACEISPTN